MLNRALLTFSGTLIAKISLALVPRERYRGFELVSFVGDKGLAILRQKIGEGLDVIQAFDGRRSVQVAERLPRFILVSGGGDHFSPVLRAHMVDANQLSTRTNAQMALNIVHEATHARVHSAGIPMTEDTASRIERICVREQIAFAQRLPDCEQTIRQLEKVLDHPWWGSKPARSRAEERLRGLGVPRLLIKLVLILRWGWHSDGRR